jgi:hypothetical protein
MTKEEFGEKCQTLKAMLGGACQSTGANMQILEENDIRITIAIATVPLHAPTVYCAWWDRNTEECYYGTLRV